jgi:hypothetical protein
MKLNEAKQLKIGDIIYHNEIIKYNLEPVDFTIIEKNTSDIDPEFFYAEIKHGKATIAYMSNEGRRRTTGQNRWVFPIEEFELTIEKAKEKT